MATKYRPFGDRCVIEPIGFGEKTDGGILIPESAQVKNSMQGKVLAVSGSLEGKIKLGDIVAHAVFSGITLLVDRKQLKILEEKEILAIVDEM